MTVAGRVGEALAIARADIPPSEARLLLARLLGRDPAWLEAHRDDPLAGETAARYAQVVARRAAGEPVAYILGSREFYGREFAVTPAVLIPRPETELLVDWALGKAKREEAPRILDLGTGSGCIAVTLALELPRSRVTAVDLSKAALAVAAGNAGRLGARVDFRHGDWFSAVAGEGFDMIVANPPYVAEGDGHLAEGDVRFEPRSALAAGSDGLDDIRRIVGTASGHLEPEGWLAVEHGWDQGEKCAEIFHQSHFCDVVQIIDLSGTIRITTGLARKVTI